MVEKRILALDQTLTNTGWVVLEGGNGSLEVLMKGIIKCSSDLSSHEASYDKAEQLMYHLAMLTDKIAPLTTEDFVVVFERPAVRGFRIESALMAGREVVRMAEAMGWRWEMVSNLTMKKFLGIKVKGAKKSDVKDKLMAHTDVSISGWNEHNRDACAIGLTYLEG